MKKFEISDRTKKWWKAAGNRALRTMAQVFIATIGSTAMLTEVNWYVVFSTVALAGVLSFATSLASLPEVELEEKLESYDS